MYTIQVHSPWGCLRYLWEPDMHVFICKRDQREKSLRSYVLTQASCVTTWSRRCYFIQLSHEDENSTGDDVSLRRLLVRNVCTCSHNSSLKQAHVLQHSICQQSNIQINKLHILCGVTIAHTSTHKWRTKRGLWSVLTKPEWTDVSELLPHSIDGVGEEHGWCKLRQRQILISLLQKASSSEVFDVLAAEAFPLLCWWIQPDPESTAGELRAQTVGIAFCSVSAFMWKYEHCGHLSVAVAEWV